MPIWIRRFTFQKLRESYEKKAEAVNKTSSPPKKKEHQILRPGVGSNYTTKTSKK